jgi:hypothetical protein
MERYVSTGTWLKARRWEASWEYTALKTRQMPDWTDESESERRPGGPAGRARTASGASCAESPHGATFLLRLSERTREVREIRLSSNFSIGHAGRTRDAGWGLAGDRFGEATAKLFGELGLPLLTGIHVRGRSGTIIGCMVMNVRSRTSSLAISKRLYRSR